MYYAQITSGIVTAVTETSGSFDQSDMVALGFMDTSLLGHSYAGGVFTPPAPVADPCEWLIDIGPFYDRFGPAKMVVLTSTDAGVKAILSDTGVRKWIDLKRTDVASSLAYIGSKVPAVDATLQTAILTTPVAHVDNLALRKQFFS